MKRVILAALPLLLLTACSAGKPRPSDDEFFVTVELGTSIKGAALEYSLGGEPQGGRMLTDAFGGLFGEGERLRFDFTARDFEFPEKLSAEKFGVYFTVLDEDGCEFRAELPESFRSAFFTLTVDGWEWRADFGGEYAFSLERTENGYMISPSDEEV